MSLELTSERLIYKLLAPSDLDFLDKCNQDTELRHFFPNGTKTREQTKEKMNYYFELYLSKGIPSFIIYKIDGDGPIGSGHLFINDDGDTEVGYLLIQEVWGKGYATEILARLLRYAINNLRLDKIVAITASAHKASIRVMEKCGMQCYKTDIEHGIEYVFYRFDMVQ